MNPFIAFLLGGFLLGSEKEKIIVLPPEIKKEEILVGKCKACPEIGLFREELGFFADDFCYKMYTKNFNNLLTPHKE